MEEKRLALITEFITTVAGAAMDALSSSSGGESGKAEEVKRRFEEWKQRLSTQEAE